MKNRSSTKLREVTTAGDRRANRIEVVTRPIAALEPDRRNPRAHSARQIHQIARSIEAFGFNVPILVDASRRVIAGHGRIMACKLLGWTEVPTISLEHLSPAQAKAFMIADNRLTDNSTWDDRLLAEQLKELSVLDLEFSLEDTGFEMGEIDLRIDGLTQMVQATDPCDDLSTLPSGPPIARAGDLWLLGQHRVCCGSALDSESYLALMSEELADLVFADPPYNVAIGGNVSGLGAVNTGSLRWPRAR